MSDERDDNIKIAIGELLREADPVSKLVIGSYNHSSLHAVNVKSLSSSKFKTEQLETCLNFLGLKPRNDSNQLIFTNKPTLADRIITKIESFFPSTCQDCGDGYRVKFSELNSTPRLQCFLCLQPSHDCEVVKAHIEALEQIPTKLVGNVWICSGCFEKNNPLLSNNPRKRLGSVTLDNITPNSSPVLPRNGPSQSPSISLETEEPVQNSPAHSLATVRHVSISEEHLNNPTICQQYANNRCPHGMNGNKVVDGVTCSNLHPRRCRHFCQFGTKRRGGCQKGDNCSYFHPKLCRNSVNSSTCFNENCKFVHLKSTKRRQDRNESNDRRNRSQSRENGRQPQERLPASRSDQERDHRFYPQRVRYDSTVSQQNRPITPSLGGYTSNSSEVSFLVRMIQDMKNDFQKDLTHLRESISSHPARWNPPVPQPGPSLPPQYLIQQDQHLLHQPPLMNQHNPLWSQNTPLFSS